MYQLRRYSTKIRYCIGYTKICTCVEYSMPLYQYDTGAYICNAADQLWIAANRGNIPFRDNLRFCT